MGSILTIALALNDHRKWKRKLIKVQFIKKPKKYKDLNIDKLYDGEKEPTKREKKKRKKE
tara:strand:+ start:320 stop:499 length:180 start_codon:yes stop_codon:yes gene_type:complete